MRAQLESRARDLWARIPKTLRAALLFFLTMNVGFLWGIHDANARAPCLAIPNASCPKYPDPQSDYALGVFCLAVGWAGAGLFFLAYLWEVRPAPRRVATAPRDAASPRGPSDTQETPP